jgi:hypothetical protein
MFTKCLGSQHVRSIHRLDSEEGLMMARYGLKQCSLIHNKYDVLDVNGLRIILV